MADSIPEELSSFGVTSKDFDEKEGDENCDRPFHRKEHEKGMQKFIHPPDGHDHAQK